MWTYNPPTPNKPLLPAFTDAKNYSPLKTKLTTTSNSTLTTADLHNWLRNLFASNIKFPLRKDDKLRLSIDEDNFTSVYIAVLFYPPNYEEGIPFISLLVGQEPPAHPFPSLYQIVYLLILL